MAGRVTRKMRNGSIKEPSDSKYLIECAHPFSLPVSHSNVKEMVVKKRERESVRMLYILSSSNLMQLIPVSIHPRYLISFDHLFWFFHYFPSFFSLGVFAFSLAMLFLSATCVVTSVLLIVALCAVSRSFFYLIFFRTIYSKQADIEMGWQG